MNVFDDQAEFMKACGQTTGQFNSDQIVLYMRLIGEEVSETADAIIQILSSAPPPTVAQLAAAADGALDVIVVAVGLLHSLGVDPPPLWDEVVRSNLAKADPVTGRVRKRVDGKVLKPAGWQPPQLEQLIEAQSRKRAG